MSATERLRAMLDERGVEYEPIDSVHSPNRRTLWGKVERGKGIFGLDAKYETIEFKKGMRLTISDCSPEQAIEATLGSSELRKERDALDRLTDVLNATNDGLLAENSELRELVRRMFYAVHPADREKFLTNVAELGVEV